MSSTFGAMVEKSMPPNHCGKWGSTYYYKGLVWLGESNRIGCKKDRPFVYVEGGKGEPSGIYPRRRGSR